MDLITPESLVQVSQEGPTMAGPLGSPQRSSRLCLRAIRVLSWEFLGKPLLWVELCSSLNSYVRVLPLRTSECELT